MCAIVHSILHAYPREPSGPAELLRHVNRHLCAKRIECSFVTAFLAFYQAATRELVYARAGHNPPLLLSGREAGGAGRARGAGRCDRLAAWHRRGCDLQRGATDLAEGQMVLLNTDGITEAKAPDGEQFETQGIEAASANCGDDDDGADGVGGV